MRVFTRLLFFVIVAGLTTSCSSSRIILLDSPKADEAIVVETKKGELVLNELNTFTELFSAEEQPAAAKSISPDELQARYGGLLAFAPKTPVSFLLYFEEGSVELTSDAKLLFPEIVETVNRRIPCDVNIIGHSDRMGSKVSNIELSLKRARLVEDWLLAQNLDITKIIVESYGEEDLLVETADEVAEPRNRRVEILIR
jgi:outer membrane protein OmpA-like peptidoglycan-associated protein